MFMNNEFFSILLLSIYYTNLYSFYLYIFIIFFPGNVTGVSPNADAILFTSLLNSEDPYFISGAQALGAILVKKYNIEPLPTGYIIIGENTTAWFVGRAKGIPFEKNKIAVM